jgi:hypothetical protein
MSLSSSAVDQCRYRLGTPARLIAVRPALVFPVDAIRVGSTLTAAAPASKNSQLSNLTNVIVDAPVIDMDVGARSHELFRKWPTRQMATAARFAPQWSAASRGRLGSRCRCCSGNPLRLGLLSYPVGDLPAPGAYGFRTGCQYLRPYQGVSGRIAQLLDFVGSIRPWLTPQDRAAPHSRTHAGLQAEAAARLSMPSR